MSSFDSIKNHADFIRNNGIDAFGNMGEYVKHQENLWNILTTKATKDTDNVSDKENKNDNN